MSKVYLREYGRPLGIQPKIFHSKEEATVKCNCEYDPENDLHGCSPWCEPEVLEFENELAARRHMKEWCPMSYEELVNAD